MGRKGKKRVTPSTRTPTRTPARTPTSLSALEEANQTPAAPPADPQQPSPPLSPEAPTFIEQHDPEPSSIQASAPSVADNFQRASPPLSPQLPAGSPSQRYDPKRSMEPSRRLTSPASRGNYGANPHVIACVSCNDICVLTGPRGVLDRMKVCPGASPNDRFFPVVCSACEDWRGSLWLRIEGGRKPPSREQQRLGTISTNMLLAWPLYSVIKEKFGAELHLKPGESTAVVSRAHDWWKEGILMHDKTIFLRWRFDETANDLYEIQPRPRKDEFFGQPLG